MKTPRSLRSFALCGVLGALLSATPAFGISNEELAILRSKAEAGNGIAQYNLGLLYASVGEPIADPVEAYVWLNLAADNGATGRALVLLSSQLNPSQVSEGKRRLEQRRLEIAARKAGRPVASAAASPVESPANPIVATAPDNAEPTPITGSNSPEALQNELKKLSTELAAAWAENDQLKATLAKGDSATAANEQLKRERDQLAATLAESNSELAGLRAAAANFEGERNALQQQISAAEKSGRDALATDLENARTRLRAAEAELAKAASAAGELATAQQTITSLNEKIGNLSTENERLTRSAAQAAATSEASASTAGELAAAQQTITSLNEKISRLSTENERLSGSATQAAAASEATASAQQEIQTLRAELDNTKGLLEEALAKVASGTDEAKQLEETQIKLESALRSFDLQQREIKQFQEALANIDQERESLANQLRTLKEAPAKADPASEEKIAALTAELETLRQTARELEAAQSQATDTESRAKGLEAQLARANEEKDQLFKQLTIAKSSSVPAEETTRLNAELKDARNRLAASEQALARVRADRENAAREATQRAEEKLAQLSSELETLRRERAGMEADLNEARQEREALREQVAAAQSAPDTSAALAAAQTRVQELESALSESNRQREAAREQLAATSAAPDASADLAAAQTRVQELEAALAEANRQREALRDQLAAAPATPDASGELAAAQTRIREMEGSLAAANAANASLSQELTALRNTPAVEVASLPATVAAPEADTSALQSELAETQGKLDAALRTYRLQQDELDGVRNALANIDGEREQLANRLNEANERLAQSTAAASSNQEAAAELAAVREQLRQAQNQIASLGNENLQLKNRVSLATAPTVAATPSVTAPRFSAPTRPATPAAPATRATPPAAATRTHTVVSGDTLSRIARRYYGSSERWGEILEANSGTIRDANNLTVGTTLRIP